MQKSPARARSGIHIPSFLGSLVGMSHFLGYLKPGPGTSIRSSITLWVLSRLWDSHVALLLNGHLYLVAVASCGSAAKMLSATAHHGGGDGRLDPNDALIRSLTYLRKYPYYSNKDAMLGASQVGWRPSLRTEQEAILVASPVLTVRSLTTRASQTGGFGQGL